MTDDAQRWGAELKRAMTRRNVSNADLADAIGFSTATIEHWRGGYTLPSYEGAIAASEYLTWSGLRTSIIALRSRECARCHRGFIAKSNKLALYCSRRCRQYKHVQKRNTKRGARLRERNGRRLAIWEDVGNRMCREWCPGGSEDNLCPDASCPIQQNELCSWPLADGILDRVA